MLSMDSLFAARPSWHRLRLIYIMVWRERENRPYRRHFSPRTVPAVPYLKGTPPWNTRKTPFALFRSAREKKKHAFRHQNTSAPSSNRSRFVPHSAANSIYYAIFVSSSPRLSHKAKKETHHIAIFPTHISFFISLLTHSRIVYQRYHSYCSDLTKRRRKRMDFAGLSSVKYESNLD